MVPASNQFVVGVVILIVAFVARRLRLISPATMALSLIAIELLIWILVAAFSGFSPISAVFDADARSHCLTLVFQGAGLGHCCTVGVGCISCRFQTKKRGRESIATKRVASPLIRPRPVGRTLDRHS
jgi:hypothetical protein